MNNIFKSIVLMLVFMFAIATPVYSDEACDDAIADGKAAYNSGNYATAQKHFENVVKWCGGSYGAASNWVQNCKNKQAEIKRAQEQKKQEQSNKIVSHKRNNVIETESVKKTNSVFKSYTTDSTVTDCQGHTYPIVKIGEQYWMAENLQCTMYDTESERPNHCLDSANKFTILPRYSDCRNNKTKYSCNLTPNIRKKLGYLYNWAAAVGIATEREAEMQITPFDGLRQGICPNGWHLPTVQEWENLGISVGEKLNEKSWFQKAGEKMKSKSGWYNDGNGNNLYDLNVLPAGKSSEGADNNFVGRNAYFWTSTPRNDKIYNHSYYFYIGYGNGILDKNDELKQILFSVRCVKN